MTDERTAVIAGASSAIGAAIAARLSEHRRVLLGRSAERIRAACEVTARDRIWEVDLGERTDVTDLPRAVREHAGRIDVLVLAVGAFDWAHAARADVGRAARVLDVSLTGVVALTHAALPLMGAGGAVVLIGSTASRTAFGHNGAYVAAKHGVAGFAGSVFEDVRDLGIRVSLVSPGFVAAGPTLEMGASDEELTRFLSPDDVAAAVRFVIDFPARGCVTELQLRPQRRSRFE